MTAEARNLDASMIGRAFARSKSDLFGFTDDHLLVSQGVAQLEDKRALNRERIFSIPGSSRVFAFKTISVGRSMSLSLRVQESYGGYSGGFAG